MTLEWILSIVLAMAVALWVDHQTFRRSKRGAALLELSSEAEAPPEPAETNGATDSSESTGTDESIVDGVPIPASLPPKTPRREGLVGVLLTPLPAGSPIRRALAATLLATVLWLGVFANLLAGPPPEADQVANLGLGSLIFVPMLMLWSALGWAKLSGAGGNRLGQQAPPRPPKHPLAGLPNPFEHWRGLGLMTSEPLKELRIGLTVGVGAWLAVLMTTAVVAVFLVVLGLDGWLPDQPASLVAGMAALPFSWRLVISLAAGVGEEIFFRGLLQPRIGLLASTALFAFAHVGYGEPFLLFGVTLLSLIYGVLAQRRGNVWAAVVAHALFDAIQLLFLIPLSLEAAGGSTALVVGGWIC